MTVYIVDPKEKESESQEFEIKEDDFETDWGSWSWDFCSPEKEIL